MLKEEKSVSTTINKYSDIIGNKIKEKVLKAYHTKNIKLSMISHFPFYEDSFKCKVNGFGTLQSITVSFIIYFLKDINDYNILVGSKDENNSYSDYDNGIIKVVSYFFGDTLDNSMYGEIYHELTHMFQYVHGASKNANLYDAVIQMYKDGNSSHNALETYVALSLYYSFSHEQNAMAHQFYAHLKNNDLNGYFENVLYKYCEFRNALKAYNYVMENQELSIKYVNKLELNKSIFFKRIRQGIDRMEKKCRNAYEKYMNDKQNKLSEERTLFKLGIETIYNY